MASEISSKTEQSDEFIPVNGAAHDGDLHIAAEAALSPDVERTQSKRAIKFVAVVTVLTVTVLMTAYYVVFVAAPSFPDIPVGHYIGTLSGDIAGGKGKRLPLYIERRGDVDSLFMAVLRAEWGAQQIPVTHPLGQRAIKTVLEPIIISGPEGISLKLIGEAKSDDHYGGEIFDLKNVLQGKWSVRFMSDDAPGESGAALQDLRLWLLLAGEHETVEKQIAELAKLVPQQQNDVKKLADYIDEGVSLKERSKQRYTQAKVVLDDALKTLRDRQNQAAELSRKLEVSEKITPAGRLVSLARESIERENRWIESMFQSGGEYSSPEFESEVEKGRKILELKRQIAVLEEQSTHAGSSNSLAPALEKSGEKTKPGDPFNAIWDRP